MRRKAEKLQAAHATFESGMKRASSPVMAGPKIPKSDGRIGTDVVELGVVTFPFEGGTLGTSFHFIGA